MPKIATYPTAQPTASDKLIGTDAETGATRNFTVADIATLVGNVAGADKTFRHVQNAASAVWTVNHGLNKYPAIAVVDSAGTVVIGDVKYLSLNNCQVSFSSAFAGECYAN